MILKTLGVVITTVLPKLAMDLYDEAKELIVGESEIKIEKVPDRTRFRPDQLKWIKSYIVTAREIKKPWHEITAFLNKKYNKNKSISTYRRLQK